MSYKSFNSFCTTAQYQQQFKNSAMSSKLIAWQFKYNLKYGQDLHLSAEDQVSISLICTLLTNKY